MDLSFGIKNDCEMNGEAKRRLVRRSSYPRSAGWCITSLTRSSSQCSFVLDSLKHTCTGEEDPVSNDCKMSGGIPRPLLSGAGTWQSVSPSCSPSLASLSQGARPPAPQRLS